MKHRIFLKLFAAAIMLTTNAIRVVAFAPKMTKASERPLLVSGSRLYGLFDGMKEAFTAPSLERSTLDANRETPIDRWMGWNVKSEDDDSAAISKGTYLLCTCFLMT